MRSAWHRVSLEDHLQQHALEKTEDPAHQTAGPQNKNAETPSDKSLADVTAKNP